MRLARCAVILCAAVWLVSNTAGALGQNTSKRWLEVIRSRRDFDSISRVYHQGTPYALPHAMFVIDRKDKNRIYYINSQRYRFHQDFVNANYLSLERGEEFFKNNYLDDKRRFILGTIAYQTPVDRWTFEFWEGDLISPALIKVAFDVLNGSFFQPVALKPNSLKQETDSALVADVSRVLLSEIAKQQEYQPLNVARGIGRIHVIAKLDDHTEIGDNEILVLNEVPIDLPSVAGIIIGKPSTPLSHINLLAKGWGVPNAYVKNAQELFKQYDGWWVVFETKLDTYTIVRADKPAVDAYQKQLAAFDRLMIPRSNLEVKHLASLREQRKQDVNAYGAKSANLGELVNAKRRDVNVPDGFTIPFFYYDQFLRQNGFDSLIYALLDDDKFVHDPSYRRAKLLDLQAAFMNGAVDAELRAALLGKVHAEFGNAGVFMRSSTNSEDLPNFNGAGLYSTKANVKGDEQLIDALKYVWASTWNFRAYEARERAHIPHDKVFMAVLVQLGINSESAGVMITTDPFDQENNASIYISGKRGQGERTVSGARVAEQIIYRPRSNTVKVLTRSEEDSLLTFDQNGGLEEKAIQGDRSVLTDQTARKLAGLASVIKLVFGGRNQDIEWAIADNKIYIVQARPYVSNRRGKYGTRMPSVNN